MIFYCLVANNELKCGIIYKQIMLGAGDDERKINYDWPCDVKILNSYYPEPQLEITKSAIKSILKKIVEWIGRV